MKLAEAMLDEYQAALVRFVSTDDPLTREYALTEATEMGKAFVAGTNPSIDELREIHRRAVQGLIATCRHATPGSAEHAALDRLNRGDAGTFGISVMLPQEMEQMRLHEQRWRREHGKLIALFDQTDDLIVVLDAHGQIESVNPAYTRKTGWSMMEAVSRAAAMWQGHLPGATTQRLRNDVVRRDGTRFKAEWSVSPIFDQVGALSSHVCIGRDITRQQQVDETLRENDKLRAVATLAGGIAHDFNNLLGSILGLAELCELDATEGSRQARNLGRIRQAADKAAALVRQMLDFSRRTPSNLQHMTVGEWLEDAQGLLRAVLPRHLSLEVTVTQDAPVSIDLVQMEQVLLNVVRNAAQAMGMQGGAVRIEADHAEPGGVLQGAGERRHVRLRVIDRGTGIAPELLDKIFEPFFTTKPVGEGTGLGLAAVHGIVSSHGGVVEVASKPLLGTTISIFLPVATTADDFGTGPSLPMVRETAVLSPQPACPDRILDETDCPDRGP